ncbi:PorT family protein [Pedobacter frigiditerrae]|uniref:PorT family protein n=1 Tax=Pedobacter frigiditerrae TaxID=2530452 RepID=A0A4R0MXV2_9SPHI|nr:porin family protein [Pedobacter frigiditerrae]TCC92129.1 PorT family protein [Pedobacter frigiditerrae]
MKKLLLSLTLVAGLSIAALAQEPVKFGVKAGVAFPSMSISTSGISVGFDSRTSFYVGGTADFAISNVISIQPGLTFISKGTKFNGDDFDFEDVSTGSNSATLNFSYIEIPVNLLANFKVGAGKVFFGGGPYYAFAVDAYGKSGGIKEDVDFDEDGFKRGDFGVNFLGGFQFYKGLNVHAGYGLGISSVIDDQEEIDVKFKNKVFTVGLGFTF